MSETYVHLFYDDGYGCLRDAGAQPLSFYGGTAPAVGDLVVEKGVEKGVDRTDVRNRTIHKVVARYFIPGDTAHIHLVIESRRGTHREREIVGD
jgi:predicted sugar kinase